MRCSSVENSLQCVLNEDHQLGHLYLTPEELSRKACEHPDLEFKFSLDDAGDGEQFSATDIYQCPTCKEIVVKQ